MQFSNRTLRSYTQLFRAHCSPTIDLSHNPATRVGTAAATTTGINLNRNQYTFERNDHRETVVESDVHYRIKHQKSSVTGQRKNGYCEVGAWVQGQVRSWSTSQIEPMQTVCMFKLFCCDKNEIDASTTSSLLLKLPSNTLRDAPFEAEPSRAADERRSSAEPLSVHHLLILAKIFGEVFLDLFFDSRQLLWFCVRVIALHMRLLQQFRDVHRLVTKMFLQFQILENRRIRLTPCRAFDSASRDPDHARHAERRDRSPMRMP